MGQCRDCKFWKPPEDDEQAGTAWAELGECEAVLPIWDYTECSPKLDYKEVITDEGKTRRAFVTDGSRYMATLLCRPDFGCVEFQPKAS